MGWVLFNGIMGVLFGWMILLRLPLTNDWVIGIILGLNLLLTGTTRLIYYLAARKLTIT